MATSFIGNDGRSYTSAAARDAANSRAAGTGGILTPAQQAAKTQADAEHQAALNPVMPTAAPRPIAPAQPVSQATPQVSQAPQAPTALQTTTDSEIARAQNVYANADKLAGFGKYVNKTADQIRSEAHAYADSLRNPSTSQATPPTFEAQRDHAREAATLKRLGTPAPQTPQELDKMYRATYSPQELQKMGYVSPINTTGTNLLGNAITGASTGNTAQMPAGFTPVGQTDLKGNPLPGTPLNTGVAGASPIFDPQRLKMLGFSDDQINQLAANGGLANAMQANANSLSKPTNFNIRVLENALNAKSSITNQPLGKSDLFSQVGLNGMANLQQSLGQRGTEMQNKYDSFKYTLSDAAAPQLQAYNQALDSYKATMDQYNHVQDQLVTINAAAKQHEYALDTMTKQNELAKNAAEFQAQINKQYALSQVTTDAFGNTIVFNPGTGTFSKTDPYGNVVMSSSSSVIPSTLTNLSTADRANLDTTLGVGTVGGWCGVYASSISTAPQVGDSWEEKKSKIDHRDNPKPGDKLVIGMGVQTDKHVTGSTASSGQYGHVAVVVGYDPATGNIDVVESNKDGAINKCIKAGGTAAVCQSKGVVTKGTYNLKTLQNAYDKNFGFVSGELKPGVQQKLGITAQMLPNSSSGSSLAKTVDDIVAKVIAGQNPVIPPQLALLVQTKLSGNPAYNPTAIAQQIASNQKVNETAASAYQAAESKAKSASKILDDLVSTHASFWRAGGIFAGANLLLGGAESAFNNTDRAKYDSYLTSAVEDYLYAINQGNQPTAEQTKSAKEMLDPLLPHDVLVAKVDAMKASMEHTVNAIREQSPYLPQNTSQGVPQGNTLHVQMLNGGQTGWITPAEFDSKIYKKI